MRANYKTKQQQVILKWLQTLQGRHTTVKELETHLAMQGESVGVATIYRQLEKLVEQGVLRKYFLDGKTAACYEFEPQGSSCTEHFHLKCENCGKLIHLECASFEQMQSHLATEHGFELNSLKTVLYGLCDECSHLKK